MLGIIIYGIALIKVACHSSLTFLSFLLYKKYWV